MPYLPQFFHPQRVYTNLCAGGLVITEQAGQLKHPDARFSLTPLDASSWLSEVADYGKGSTTGDGLRFFLYFWEVPIIKGPMFFWLNSPEVGEPWSGRSQVCRVGLDADELTTQLGCWIRGKSVWGRSGIAVNKMTDLEPFLYSGEVFDDNVCPICPSDESLIPAVFAYVTSDQYREDVRDVDQALKVTAGTLTKVPFDAP